MNYSTVLFIDLSVVVTCFALLLKKGRIIHSHPATIYFVYHGYTVTARLLSLEFGSPPLFSWRSWLAPVTAYEISRAVFMMDAGLIAMTGVWLWQARRARVPARASRLAIPLDSRLVVPISVLTFCCGIAGLIAFTRIPGLHEIDLTAWKSTSTWLLMTSTWCGLALIALTFIYGFRFWLVLPILGYFTVMAIQGFHRHRIIIPVILLIQIALDRKGRRWPTPRAITVALLLGVLFLPLKKVGQVIQSGGDWSDVRYEVVEMFRNIDERDVGDVAILDQFAATVTLVDENGVFFHGRTFLPLIALPIPRGVWADKPSIADFMREISRPWRPMSDFGMVATLFGEGYVNFGMIGVILVPALTAWLLGRAFMIAYRCGFNTVGRLMYLCVSASLIQVYRDGLASLIAFTCVQMMPLFILAAAHIVARRRRENDQRRLREDRLAA